MESTDDVKEIALSLPNQASSIIISDDKTYETACNFLLKIKDVRKQIDAIFDPIISKAHDAHKQALSSKKIVSNPLEEAERTIKPRLAAYDTQKEKARREQEEKLREVARKEAEDARLTAAIDAEKNGSKEDAEQILNAPSYAPSVVVQKENITPKGIVYRNTWKAEVTNLSELIQAVAAGKAPIGLLQVHQVNLNNFVKMNKDAVEVPGVRIYIEKSVAA